MYTLDTNAIIYFLKDDSRAVAALDPIFATASPLYISSVTEVELFAFPHLTTEEARHIEDLLSTVAVIPLDSRLARIAGTLRRSYRLNVADAIIAATALFTDTILLTRNVRDFRSVPDLNVQAI